MGEYGIKSRRFFRKGLEKDSFVKELEKNAVNWYNQKK